MCQLDGEDGFPQLSLKRCRGVRPEKELLGQLLGDGAAALDKLAVTQVVQGRPTNRDEVNASVLIEGSVFDRDRRLDHEGRDRAERYDDSVIALLRDVSEQVSMPVVDQEVLRQACRCNVGD